MERSEIDRALNELIDVLASIEHERWAHWQRYLHNHAIRQADGSLILPRDLVNHWEEQINTDYARLTEAEKESDRNQVRKYLPVIIAALSRISRSEGP